jgi:hypothetical protein
MKDCFTGTISFFAQVFLHCAKQCVRLLFQKSKN